MLLNGSAILRKKWVTLKLSNVRQNVTQISTRLKSGLFCNPENAKQTILG